MSQTLTLASRLRVRPNRNRKLKRPRATGGARASVGRTGWWQALGAPLWPERFPELARTEGEDHGQRSGSRGFLLVWGIAVALAALAFVLHLHVRFEVIKTGYTLSQAQAQQRHLRLQQRELRLELATLKEPGRIEQQARALHGMERPEHDRIIRLGQERQPRLASRRQ